MGYQEDKVETKSAVYSRAGDIVANEGGGKCKGIEFYNAGATVAYIGVRNIPVGAAWSPPIQFNQVDDSRYKLSFAGGADGTMIVTRVILK